jgi:hypothetical protein
MKSYSLQKLPAAMPTIPSSQGPQPMGSGQALAVSLRGIGIRPQQLAQ